MWPTSDEQAEWGERLRAGDKTVWPVVHDRLARLAATSLCRQCTRLSCDDLTSQAMIDLWEKRELYDPARGSLGSFVYVVARTTAANVLRREGREQPLSPEAGAELTAPPPPGEPSDAVRRLAAALGRLSPEHYEIVRASAAADGAPYADELAERYNTTADNIRAIAVRLRKRLRDELEPPAAGEESEP